MPRNKETSSKTFNVQTGDTILFVLFLTSISLTIWGIEIYRQTIIETRYLFAIIAFGIITGVAVLSLLVKTGYRSISTFLVKASIGGGLFYFSFLFVNQHFADKQLQIDQFIIQEKGTLGGRGCSQPYVNIDFYGIEKQLVFYCQYADSLKHSTKVNLTYCKGAFGFNIVKAKQLTD